MKLRNWIYACVFSFHFFPHVHSQVTAMLDKNQPYDKLSGNVVTPHIQWAVPYSRGKVRALVIAPALGQRETVELAHRVSLECTALMTHGYDEMYQDPKWLPHSVPVETADKIIREKLKAAYDVILIGKVSWEILPDYLRAWIEEQVHKGTGLVYVCPRGIKETDFLFACQKTSDSASFVTDSVPLKALPVLDALDEKTVFGFGLSGEGRVAKINYGEQEWGTLHSLTPARAYADWSLNYDYYHSILAKALLWAARKEPDVDMSEMKTTGDLLTVKIVNRGAMDKKVQLELVVRDRDNAIEDRQERQVKLAGGEQEVSFRLPTLKGGLHFLDVWVKENGKTLNWKSTSVMTTPECSIGEIVLDKESYKAGDRVSGRIALSRIPEKGSGLSIRMLDHFGRVMAEEKSAPRGKEVDFSFEIKEPLSLLLTIEAELSDGKQVISELRKEFPVAWQKIDDYFFAVWIQVCDNHVGDLALKQFRELGVDFDYTRPSAERYCKAAKANLGVIPYFSKSFFPGYGYSKMAQDDLVRIPCFTDPEFRAELKKSLQEDVQLNKPYSPYYSLHINGGLSPLRCITPLDLCFSPTCQKHFQEYLKKEYQSLDALNKEWGTGFQSWDEVRAMTFIQAKKHGNFAPWADHRMHMEQVFTEINCFSRDAILELAPEAVVGFDEPNVTSSYNGYDWWSLMRELDFCNPYFGKWHWRDDEQELARCFIKNRNAPRGIWFGSYWRAENFNRFIPWQSLFNGMNGVYWWVGIAARNSSTGALAPDFEPLPYFSQALEEINEIKRGIGKLLMNCARTHDKIAIYHAPYSVHAATIDAKAQLPPEKFPEESVITDCLSAPDTPTQFGSSYPLYRSQQALMTVLEDIGLQYEFVAHEQVKSGVLKEGKYKVLILPYAKALSQKESEEIKAFVQHGGMVIADRVPGVMDEHCKSLPCSLLQEMFGDAARLKVHEYGQGKAVCLHDFLDDYVFSLRMKGQEAEKREKIREILELAGVKPKLRILDSNNHDLGSTEVVFFKNGEMEYACLLKDYLTTDNSEKEATVVFPREAHIYDVRGNKYHGLCKQAPVKLSGGQAKVFALSPYKVTGLELSLDKETYCRGDAVSYKLDILADSKAPSAHAFRIELVNPENKTVRHYSKNLLAENGSCSATLQLSLNEQQGKWRLRARELISGKTAEKTFSIE
jgi:hypothetical protein